MNLTPYRAFFPALSPLDTPRDPAEFVIVLALCTAKIKNSTILFDKHLSGTGSR